MKLRVFKDYWGNYTVQRLTIWGHWVDVMRNKCRLSFDYLEGAYNTVREIQGPDKPVLYARDEAYNDCVKINSLKIWP